MKISHYLPTPMRNALKPVAYRWNPARKYEREMRFWRRRWQEERQQFRNDHYERILLGMAGESNQDFLKGQVVADFGCGPRGSLCWCTGARLCIGIDVLADRYSEFEIYDHQMCYVTSSECSIPLPTDYVDTIFTLNALDHVQHLARISAEIHRILRPGGDVIASFNLEEPATWTEPQTLTEGLLKKHLLDDLEIISYRQAKRGPGKDAYQHFFDESPEATIGKRYLWVRARKPRMA